MDLHTLHVLFQSGTHRIWRGEDQVLRSRFIIKELLGEAASNPVFLDRLADEVKFCEQFAHPRLLSVVNAGTHGMLVLEDAQCSLDQLIKRHGKLPNEQVASVLVQCLEGLSHLHGRAFAHGTLSPQNVFVDPQGYVKLGDFIGYRHERDRPKINQDRKPRYHAPEVIDSRLGKCSPSSDLYCLGFLALELLSGPEFPRLFGFDRDQDPKQWLRWHGNLDVRLDTWRGLLPEVSQALGDFVDGLIEKRSEKRMFDSAAAALKRLNELGLQARRVLPSFDSVSKVVSQTPDYRPPQRKLGPVLILKPLKEVSNLQEKRVPPDQPLLINSRFVTKRGVDRRRLALFACQENHWHLYNISETTAPLFNRQPVALDKPCRVKSGDEVQFGDDDRYLVDLEMQGTGIIRSMDLIKRIHAGRGGDLYEARWLRATRVEDVAVRLLPEDFGRDIDQIRRFLRAVPTAVKLVHPNIVRLRKAGRVRHTDRSVWYLAFEFMTGGSLRDKMRARKGSRLGLKSCKRVAVGVAHALGAAQRHQIVHRNISPSCILFDIDDHVKLGDFTLAKGEVLDTIYDITRGKLLPGDYHYQSPEVLAASGQANITADFYSVAVCLFEALAGSLPFDTTQSEAMTITTMSRFNWPSIRDFMPEIPVAWQEFLAKNLSRDPASRSASPEEFLNEAKSLPTANT